MDKIVLVAPGPRRLQFGATLHLPLALLSLAAWLRDKGGYNDRIRIVDTQVRKPEPIDFSDAAIVGISAMTGHQIKYGLKVAELAKKSNPDTIIVWGGIHPSLLPEQTVQHSLVDVVVIGEGEETFLQVVDAVFNGDSLCGIPGTCVQNDTGTAVLGPTRPFIDLDEAPLPAYDLVELNEYHGIQHQFDYQSSRGCPYRCGFCYNTTFCKRRWRAKSPERVIDELRFLAGKYGVVNFGLVDDEFFINARRIEAIFDGILNNGLQFGLTLSCRLDIVQRFSPDLLRKMKRAGVRHMFFGAESGSDKTLLAIRKDIVRKDIIEGARKVSEVGIRPFISFMSGFPGETLEDFQHTIKTILELWDLHPLVTINGIFPFNAYPGTLLYNKAVDLGLAVPRKLQDWGEWNFQYEPDNPWLTASMKRAMQISFYMIRFMYYIARYKDRLESTRSIHLLELMTSPISQLVKIRLRKRWFRMAYEWKLFAYLARKTFGYL